MAGFAMGDIVLISVGYLEVQQTQHGLVHTCRRADVKVQLLSYEHGGIAMIRTMDGNTHRIAAAGIRKFLPPSTPKA